MGVSRSKGASDEGPDTSKGSPLQKKQTTRFAASQGTRPISFFFQSTKLLENVGTASQGGGANAASFGEGGAGKRSISGDRSTVVSGRKDKAEGEPKMRAAPKKPKLVPGQTRLPFVPPRRITGGSSSTTAADAPSALQASEPLPPPNKPQAEASATALHHRGSSAPSYVPRRCPSNGALKTTTKYPGAYEAVASASGPGAVSRSIKIPLTLGDHLPEEDGAGPVAANIRRAAIHLSGRTGEMPLIDEELPRAGRAGSQQSEGILQENQAGDGVQLEATGGSGGPVAPQWAPPLLSMEQRLAATSSFHSPLMIIAGAGTGKTQTMATRVVEMLRNGIPPWNILALSFTNKAASELEERITRIHHATLAAEMPGLDLCKLTVSTFHSLGFRWVRFFHRALAFAKMPAVYEKRQKEQVVARCTEMYKREKDRTKACEYLGLRKGAQWQEIFARWSQVSPKSYRSCEEGVRKLLEEGKRKRKQKQQKEATKRAKTEKVKGKAIESCGPPLQSETTEASEQAKEAAGGESDESDVTEWENELAEAVYKEIWSRELRKSTRFEESQLEGIWKGRWHKVPKPKEIVKEIERAKTYGYRAADYEYGADAWSDIFRLYEIKMQEANALDFDDMLRLLGQLLDGETCRAAKRRFQAQFKFILVDEYQDTNSVQSKIVQNFYESMDESCITVVGDDDQSIYGFRGANCRAFKLFMSHFFGVSRSLLQENYRSTGNILKVGAEVIKENVERVEHKTLRPTKEQGEPVLVVEAGVEEDEAAWIAQKITETMAAEGNSYKYRDFALLLRNFKFGPQGSISFVFQKALQRQKIPFKITGGQSIYERAEVVDVMAYLSLILDEDNDEAFERVCNKPARGMDPGKNKSKSMTVIQAVQGQLENGGQKASLFIAAKEALRRGDVEGANAQKVRGFVEQIEALQDFATCHSVGDTIREVLSSTKYGEFAKKKRQKERRKSREKAGRKGERDSDFDSDDEAELEGGHDLELEGVTLDEEELECEESGEEEQKANTTEKREEDAANEMEKEERDAAEVKEMGCVLAGFVKEGEHFTGQWTAGLPEDAKDALPSLYTRCQLKVCEYALAGLYDVRELRQAFPDESFADDVFGTQKLGRTVLRDFVVAIALQKEENATAEAERDAVTISTIHRAKGLEWPVVFVPRWNQGFFPTPFRGSNVPVPNGREVPEGRDEQGHIEEERRLAHVACTRAKDRLYISYIRILSKTGKPERLDLSSFSLPEDPSICCHLKLDRSQEEQIAIGRLQFEPGQFGGFRRAADVLEGVGGFYEEDM